MSTPTTNNKRQTTKVCQNCRQPFVIEPEDFTFYDRIKVPAPTWCPECRWQRRLTFQNWVHLYKYPCALCKKDMISMYSPEEPYIVYCPRCWWGDGWDSMVYGRDYDFSRPFFEQFRDLMRVTPLEGLAIDIPTVETSPYTNHSGHLKNCYLVFWGDFDEDCLYGTYLSESKLTLDSSLIMESELVYDSMHAFKVHNGIGLRSQVTESLDCAFLKDCMNCQNCFASANLRNRKYCIFNVPYSKEQYFEKVRQWDLGSYKSYTEVQRLAEEHWTTLPPKPTMDEFTANVSGSHIFQSKNAHHCFEVVGVEDSKYLSMLQLGPNKDCYDVSGWGNNMSLTYDSSNVGENMSNVRFCTQTGINFHDGEYNLLSTGGAHHFGCVSMKKGEYRILNKQYSKEEYEALTARIRKHMHAMPYTDAAGHTFR